MKTRACEVCGEEFEVHHWHARICGSKGCHRERDRRAAWHRRKGPGVVPPPTKGWRTWTEREDDLLRWNWGQVSRERLEEILGHSWAAINWRAVRLGLGSLARGTLTLTEIAERTGYSRRSLQLYAERLGISLRKIRSCLPRGERTKPRRYAIDTSEAERLIAWLATRTGRPIDDLRGWGHYGRVAACLCCGRTDRPHNGRGLCETCYAAAKRQGRICEYALLNERAA